MHMKHEVRLPDHDFTVALMHKLIPSVVDAMDVKEKTYSREAVT